ncbi:hypothetical protein [Myroides odoratus]|uniref:Uncharacterized protein n=1 Tax=Myroides odoratus TaxID=256 RepID=A0A9Q6Z5R8_MYROD|nr:hypothetical protein [Myroides odoratus]EHQ44483.1 hypothetical protein Myrod_3686 [Myroides odoratus DSM 2801]EKB03667.1 hypothetical protein HMPREF9716_03496 [Myroides odoratus CIP 103059]QQU01751.1 hypothetical protein I6I88_08430 [Myroides odoratus]WQD55966.1 hypothetical protein U0010_10555 [Myroides odoratus]STZ31822.1 Uncharacterised protein [Myroides odoratus]
MKNLLLVLAFMLSIGAFAQVQNSGNTVPVMHYTETVYDLKLTCTFRGELFPRPILYTLDVTHPFVGSTPPSEMQEVLGNIVNAYVCTQGEFPSWVTIKRVKFIKTVIE